ncbi:MAG: DUF3192 domain-containing protein [Lysobacterales bacterium]
MKLRYHLAFAAFSVLLLSGCVIVTDPDDNWEYHSNSWEHRQEDNQTYIADLRLGTALEQVKLDLGRPDHSEGFMSDGREIIVLRYRTQHRHSDGDTTFDETTPLVFVDGALAGWGESVVREFPVNQITAN